MLSELAVRQAKPKDRDYKLSDAEGLHLFVAKSGHRSWRLKYRFAGKERRLILGSYPAVSLKEARERKCEARRLLEAGRDPGIEAKKQAVQRAAANANTFESLARTWFAASVFPPDPYNRLHNQHPDLATWKTRSLSKLSEWWFPFGRRSPR